MRAFDRSSSLLIPRRSLIRSSEAIGLTERVMIEAGLLGEPPVAFFIHTSGDCDQGDIFYSLFALRCAAT